jgi:hypothetical protein
VATADVYKAHILSFVEGKDPLEVQRQTPAALTQLITGISESELYQRPEPAKWSVAEVLAHFAEAEIVNSWRYRQMIEHNGCAISPYDQELWNSLGDYASRPPSDSLTLFRLLRENNVRMFDRLASEQWENYGMHSERGRLTVRELVQLIAGHDLNHLEQIRNILEG